MTGQTIHALHHLLRDAGIPANESEIPRSAAKFAAAFGEIPQKPKHFMGLIFTAGSVIATALVHDGMPQERAQQIGAKWASEVVETLMVEVRELLRQLEGGGVGVQ
jgi:hypothetical protein